jgi:hypothetical protein
VRNPSGAGDLQVFVSVERHLRSWKVICINRKKITEVLDRIGYFCQFSVTNSNRVAVKKEPWCGLVLVRCIVQSRQFVKLPTNKCGAG